MESNHNTPIWYTGAGYYIAVGNDNYNKLIDSDIIDYGNGFYGYKWESTHNDNISWIDDNSIENY